MEFWVDLVKAAWDCGIFERTTFKVIPFQVTIAAALSTDVEICTLCVLLFHIRWTFLQILIVAMPPAGRIEAAERAERAAAGPSWSQGRGASDAVGLSTRFFIPCG